MERTRSKAKAAKAEKEWKRLQELKENDVNASKLKKVVDKNDDARKNPPLKEIA